MAAYSAIAILTSLPAFARHAAASAPAAATAYACFMAVASVCLWWTSRGDLGRRIGNGSGLWTASWAVPAVLIAGLAAVNLALYPTTRGIPRASSGPDAMIVPVARLLAGHNPYAGLLRDGAPISPGPGWLLLNAPLTGTGLIGVLTPVWLALAAALIWRRRPAAALPFVLLVAAPVDFLQMSFIGDDLFAISLAVAVLCLVAETASPAMLMAAGLLGGLVATARLPMLLPMAVIGAGLWRTRGRDGLVFSAIVLSVAVAFHAGFWLWAVRDGVAYQPLHLFSRAAAGAGPVFTGLGVACGGLATWWIARHPGTGAASWMFSAWLLQTALFAPIGIGELINVQHFAWNLWEGKNYVAYPLPLLCGYLALRALQMDFKGRAL